jgi:hypothetical protein
MPEDDIPSFGVSIVSCIIIDDEIFQESQFWPTAMIRPKSQNSNIGHYGILSIGNFILMMKNLMRKSGAWILSSYCTLWKEPSKFGICLRKTEQNSDFALFPILDPKARLRFEILFKKTHPRINLTTLFLTNCLLNPIKPFSSHENCSLTKFQNPLQRKYPKKPEFKSSGYIVLFLDPKLLNKGAVRFVLWWNSLNKFFISPFWVGIWMGGTLRTQSFDVLGT